MRKILLGLVAAAAIATPLAAATAANAATTDANGVVTVSKGEVIAQFPGMNETAFQKIAMTAGESLTGSDVTTFTTETTWGCSDGSIQHHYRNTIRTTPMTFTEIYNGSANKVTGWTIGPRARRPSSSEQHGRQPLPVVTTCAGGLRRTSPRSTCGRRP